MSLECLEVLVIHAARPKLTCLLLLILINTVALCTKIIPLKISTQKSTFTTVFLTFFGFRRRVGWISDDIESRLVWIQNVISLAYCDYKVEKTRHFCRFYWMLESSKAFSFRVALFLDPAGGRVRSQTPL